MAAESKGKPQPVFGQAVEVHVTEEGLEVTHHMDDKPPVTTSLEQLPWWAKLHIEAYAKPRVRETNTKKEAS
jgi:hypothetical protein